LRRAAGALIWVGGAILGLFLLRAVTSVIGRWLLARINQRAAGAMQVDMLRHILTLDAGFFQNIPPGKLIERVQGDTMAAQGASILVIGGVGRDVVSR
jgi:ATP-binding cassette, subfamily B, bacterial MsbA